MCGRAGGIERERERLLPELSVKAGRALCVEPDALLSDRTSLSPGSSLKLRESRHPGKHVELGEERVRREAHAASPLEVVQPPVAQPGRRWRWLPAAAGRLRELGQQSTGSAEEPQPGQVELLEEKQWHSGAGTLPGRYRGKAGTAARRLLLRDAGRGSHP